MADNPSPSKRESILRAALDIFSTRGFHSAKMEDIAQEAGVGKGTVYEYFQSKEHLFRETIKEGLTVYNSLVREEMGREDTAAGKLAGLIALNFRYGRRFRPLARIAMLESIAIDDEFRSWLREMHLQRLEIIERIVGKGMERGEFRPVDALLFARLFYGGMNFTVSPFMDLEINEDEIEKFAAEIAGYYLKGIGS
mgnify:CR=1 FL=1